MGSNSSNNNHQLEFRLPLDQEKSKDLKKGKKVYINGMTRWYLTKDEFETLGEPQEVVLEVKPA